MSQKIFKSSYVSFLREELKRGTSLSGYFAADFSPPSESQLESAIKAASGNAGLRAVQSSNPRERATTDLENAIALYEAYPGITEVQASDPRLWTYLAHVTFRKYVMDRWPLECTMEEINADEKAKISAVNFILAHWFAGGNDRALRRNAIARLWWAVHLTVAPWENDPQFFAGLKHKDRYLFTRVLFSTQDVFQQVLERGLGRDSRVLISILDYIRKKEGITREEIRDIMKELNLISSVKNVSALSRAELADLISSIAAEDQ